MTRDSTPRSPIFAALDLQGTGRVGSGKFPRALLLASVERPAMDGGSAGAGAGAEGAQATPRPREARAASGWLFIGATMMV